MRSILGLIAVVALASGLIGAFAVNELSDEAGAAPGCPPKCPTPSATASPTPAPPQQREDQINILTYPTTGDTVEYKIEPGVRIALDPGDYPTGAMFRFEAVRRGTQIFEQTQLCVHLYDFTTSQSVSGTEVCGVCCPTPGWDDSQLSRSAPFPLPSGEHQYGVAVLGNSSVTAARIIIEWTE